MTDTAAPPLGGLSVTTIPRPDAPVPALALPTIALLLGALATWAGSTALALGDVWPWPLSVPINAAAAFALFTVSHEASHRTLSTHAWVNSTLGRLATVFYIPHGSFPLFRFSHMQHHRFTNDPDGNDPDAYVGHGRGLELLARWMTIDFAYARFYLLRRTLRPRGEVREAAVVLVLVVAAVVAGIATGHALLVLGLWLLPSRIALTVLAWSFDYLPHHGMDSGPDASRFRKTVNRVGFEKLLTPVLLYQNYHLVHHLHPVIPFYKYIAVWRANEDAYLGNDPALCDPRGRPITIDEYRRMRALAEHH